MSLTVGTHHTVVPGDKEGEGMKVNQPISAGLAGATGLSYQSRQAGTAELMATVGRRRRGRCHCQAEKRAGDLWLAYGRPPWQEKDVEDELPAPRRGSLKLPMKSGEKCVVGMCRFVLLDSNSQNSALEFLGVFWELLFNSGRSQLGKSEGHRPKI